MARFCDEKTFMRFSNLMKIKLYQKIAMRNFSWIMTNNASVGMTINAVGIFHLTHFSCRLTCREDSPPISK